jgi:hypothetical protein
VKEFKGVTSFSLRQEFQPILSKLPTLWTRSYLAATAGSVSAEGIKAYIEAQKGVQDMAKAITTIKQVLNYHALVQRHPCLRLSETSTSSELFSILLADLPDDVKSVSISGKSFFSAF